MNVVKAFLAVIGCLLVALPAYAASLDSAKAQGLVGERLDGYIGAVAASPSQDVRQLVDEINRARKAEYAKIAAKNGQPVSVVEKLAAKKLIERTGGGQYYMDGSGNWVRK